jgi:hypothetical protein
VVSVRDMPDFNAGNKQAVAFVAAFSTGNSLDSACIRGRMLRPDSTPVSNATLLLFAADNAKGDSILGKVPAYMARTSDGGTFEFPYLRGAAYRIYGITDTDNTNSFTLSDEGLALPLTPLITLGKRDTVDSVGLTFFKPDGKVPQVRSAKWIGRNTLAVGLSEGIIADSLRIALSDTTGSDRQELAEFSLAMGKETELLIHTHRNAKQPGTLVLTHLRDSTGNQADTTLRVMPGRTRTLEEGPLLIKPRFSPKDNALVMYLPEWLDSIPRSQIAVVDTGKKAVPVQMNWDQYRLSIALKGKLPPGGAKLVIPGSLLPAVSGEKDTTWTLPLPFPDPEQFGLVAGTVSTPGYDGPVVLLLVQPGKRGVATTSEFVAFSREFRFTMVPPGKYKIVTVKDLDGNHVWTTGSLHPYRMPEATRISKDEIEVKANWELEELKITW